MTISVLRVLFGAAALALAASVQAVTYMPSMNEAEWRLQLSPFECRMWQPIPVFGDAVFSSRAGERQRFYLAPKKQMMKQGKAKLVSAAPVWDAGRKKVDLGYVGVNAVTSVKLDENMSLRLLNELYDGMSPVFARRASFASSEQIRVGLSSINFRRAYKQYRDCLVSLLPVNFEQIKRTRLHFKTAKFDLTPRARGVLDNIVRYVKADTTVTGFFIDGHTDSVGRRLYNLDLSKNRAEAVTKYLVAKGIDEAMITTRYHGERYPVVNNSNSKNRAANRRVTVRLERDGF